LWVDINKNSKQYGTEIYIAGKKQERSRKEIRIMGKILS
jgi:hypothetical protein